jgi:hypothetical protein
MSDGKFAILHQRHRCVYHSRQLGRSGVTSTALHGKENSVRHQIRFHSVVGASLHQRNLAAFHRRRLLHATDFSKQPLRSALAVPCIAKRRGKCHGHFFTFSCSRPLVLAVTSPDDFGDMDC